MFPRLFHRLRRCHALFALALCAWLTLASAAWAQPTCCDPMGMSPGMAMPHGHDIDHLGNSVPDGCCVHASLQLPAPLAQNLPSPMPATARWQRHREVAPQPFYEPPLRPPVA